MFYPVFENSIGNPDLIIAIIKYEEYDVGEDAPAGGFTNSRYINSDDIETLFSIGEFDWGDYYLEEDFEFETLKEAQQTLLKWVIK